MRDSKTSRCNNVSNSSTVAVSGVESVSAQSETYVDTSQYNELFYFCVSVHRSISQIKHQLDAKLCRFYFCRVILHVSGVKRPSSY